MLPCMQARLQLIKLLAASALSTSHVPHAFMLHLALHGKFAQQSPSIALRAD